MPHPDRSPFDPSIDEMRSMGHDVVDLLSRFVDDRYAARTSDLADLAPLLAMLSEAPRDEGTGLRTLMSTVEAAAGKGFDPANPGFVAYIPGGGLYASALADFMACVFNRY
ncbi:MAG: aromatic-L-amino-acid/L-tryptophan decarboxylase, partial [Gaiellales bacterium]|nr:aromatic-L-amino-acid/L-tryptophan decarboxylase [Gaiellales bacterium]